MTLPKGYKAPNKKEISDNKDLGNNNSATNEKNNSLTDEILKSTTIDDTINKVLERGNEVVTNLEDTVKEVIEKDKDVTGEDSSTIDKSIRYEDQPDKSQLTQENQMNKKNENNYNDNSNLGISKDKSSTKEELTTTIPTTTKKEVGGTKSGDKESPVNIKSIVFGLFALIGFIILVYSIFMGIVGEPLASVADTIFVAVIIGCFTLVGVIVGRAFLKK
jgi:ABC-type Na+ efflux pump permease subunit